VTGVNGEVSRVTDTEVERARMVLRDAMAELSGEPAAVAELVAAERRLDEPLRVALVGKLKSGKSTLLNALVGEEIAPTDATECTRVVTWFARSAGPRIDLTDDGGRRRSLPVHRVDGRLRLDLGPVPADRVERLVVGWPSSLLERYTIIDTPGTSSHSADASARTLAFLDPERGGCEAEAIIFLMRSRHDSDLELLRDVRRRSGGGGPLGVVGVLSRADEIDDPAGRGAALRTDPELAGLPRDFVAVSGLLAVRGQTLRQGEFAALHTLAGLPDEVLEAALLSAGRFASVDLPVARAQRERLLEGFGLIGIRVAVGLVRGGARDAPTLAAELVRRSGLDELRRILDARFGGRHGQLKAHAALAAARRVLLGVSPTARPRAARLLRAVDRLLAGSHADAELRVLATVAALPVPEAVRDALDRALGGRGTTPAARLGLPADAHPEQLRRAALRELARWRHQLDHPLLDPPTGRAFRAAARSCEVTVSRTG
jgi:hypothetical protein